MLPTSKTCCGDARIAVLKCWTRQHCKMQTRWGRARAVPALMGESCNTVGES